MYTNPYLDGSVKEEILFYGKMLAYLKKAREGDPRQIPGEGILSTQLAAKDIRRLGRVRGDQTQAPTYFVNRERDWSYLENLIGDSKESRAEAKASRIQKRSAALVTSALDEAQERVSLLRDQEAYIDQFRLSTESFRDDHQKDTKELFATNKKFNTGRQQSSIKIKIELDQLTKYYADQYLTEKGQKITNVPGQDVDTNLTSYRVSLQPLRNHPQRWPSSKNNRLTIYILGTQHNQGRHAYWIDFQLLSVCRELLKMTQKCLYFKTEVVNEWQVQRWKPDPDKVAYTQACPDCQDGPVMKFEAVNGRAVYRRTCQICLTVYPSLRKGFSKQRWSDVANNMHRHSML